MDNKNAFHSSGTAANAKKHSIQKGTKSLEDSEPQELIRKIEEEKMLIKMR